MKKYWVFFLSLMMLAPSAFAHKGLASIGGINYGLDSATATASAGGVTATATAKGGLGFAGGLLWGFGTLELGGLFITKTYTTSVTGSADVSTSTTGVQIPVLARIGGGSTTFGVGGFYELGSSSDYGLSAGPRFGGANGGTFVDLRFNLGLKGGTSKDVLAMIGYAFGNSK